MAGDFLPNSFQTPNAYVDQLMHLLTDQEWKVVSYAMRRIYGFNKRQDRISLSQFSDGTRSHATGKVLDHGTGLGRGTIIKALNALVTFGILIRVDDPHDGKTAQAGTCYMFQLSSAEIDRAGLEARHDGKTAKNQRRTSTATTHRLHRSGTSHEPLGGTSDVHTLNRGKPEENQSSSCEPHENTPQPDSDDGGDEIEFHQDTYDWLADKVLSIRRRRDCSRYSLVAVQTRWRQVATGDNPALWGGRLVKSLTESPPTATNAQTARAAYPPLRDDWAALDNDARNRAMRHYHQQRADDMALRGGAV